MSLAKVQHHYGIYDDITIDQRLALVTEYRKLFRDSVALCQSLPAKVNQHGDYYAIQAAHLLLDVYQETGECMCTIPTAVYVGLI